MEKAINAKTLEVTFNKAVDDTKAVFAVTRDGFKINHTDVVFSADKKSATIELTSKITKGDYAVTVTGLTDEKISGSVTTENEKVAAIEVLTTEVPLSDLNSSGAIDDLAVPYKVTNQYGEDITKTTPVVASSGTVNAAKGVVEFLNGYNTTTNKTVAFTLINVASNVSTTATVTAVAKSTESVIDIKGVYNKDNKTLTETSDLSKDKFYLEVEVKDQYGKVIKNPTAANLLISETNTTVVDAKNIGNQVPVLDTTVEGKVLIELEGPLKAGESTITLISKNTGNSSNYKVVVAEGVRVNTLTLGQPDIVSEGEKALIPVTAVDKNGAVITDLDVLNSSTRGIKVDAPNKLVKKDGMIYLETGVLSTAGPQVALATVIPTQTIATVNFTVQAAAKPSVITGLSKDTQTSISTGLTQEIKAEDLVIEDQFGRVMTKTAINAWIDAAPGNSLVVNSSKEVTDNSPFELTSTDTAADNAKQVLTGSGKILTVTAKANATNQVKTEKLTFALSTDSGATTIAATSKDVTFTKVDVADFASYEVSAPTAIFNAAGNTFDFKVYGVKADNSKVLLKEDQYNLVLPTGFTAGGTNKNTITLTNALTDIASPATAVKPESKDFTFKVVVKNNAATTLNKKVTVSAAPKDAAEVVATTTGNSNGVELSTLSFVPNGKTAVAGTVAKPLEASDVLDWTALDQYIYFVDQYGVESATKLKDVNLTFSNVENVSGGAAPTITSNGEETAAVTGLDVKDTLTVKVEANGVVKSYNVVIKAGL